MKNGDKKTVCFCDCETQAFARGIKEYYPYIIGCLECVVENETFVEKEYHEFLIVENFIDWIRKKECIAYFHNGGKFDMLFFKKYINQQSVLFINMRLAEYRIGKAVFRDSYLLVPIALADFEKEEFDYRKLKDYKTFLKHKEEVSEYLESDCRNLKEIMVYFFGVFGLRLTIASACLEFFRKTFRVKKKDFKTKSQNYDRIFRQFYFGGRCEVFRSGVTTGKIKCFDINSAYPFAMTRNHAWRFEYADVTGEEVEGSDFVVCEGVAKGCFPFRDEKTKSLSFPRDNIRRTYHITGWEYIAALRCKAFDGKVIQLLRHFHKRNFAEYVEHFYAMKKNNPRKSGLYTVAKIALNSLYGKFAQNPEQFKEFVVIKVDSKKGFEESYRFEGKEYTLCEIISSDLVLCCKPCENLTYYNVAVSASITGFVRAYLYETMHNSKTVCYCDTDSIFCEKIASFAEMDESKLGAWKIEAEIDTLHCFGKKLYAGYSNGELVKYANKGTRLNAEQFLELIEKGRVVWENDRPTFHAKGQKQCDYLVREISQNAFVTVALV